ncbi:MULTISPECIES: hypothetical protein [Bacteria]|uniref:Uncharacterized protein n=1 Tax=Streptomyces sindenensis TaxID=67363 RepID=A0ABW6ER14_9ACTN
MCRRIFAALEDHIKADPETWLTTEKIGQVVGLKTRAAQYHIAHLFAHGRIDANRRTPLTAGIGQPPLPGAQTWATAVVAPDPTCAKCLIALARYGWEGQVSTKELAEAVGLSVRSVETHRTHLVRADLVRFRPTPRETESGRKAGRLPDRFTLLSGISAPKLVGDAFTDAPTVAARLLDRVRWFVGTTGEQRENGIKSVAWCLRNGWPESALLAALDASENRQAYAPGGYLSTLLKKLPSEYIIPARDAAQGETAPVQVRICAICDNSFRTRRPGVVFCGDTVCLTPDEAVIPPAARVYNIA